MSNQQAAAVEHHVDEGHSVAGWIGVTIILLGFAIGAVGMFMEIDILLWIGLALVPLGAIAWPVLKAVGFGPKDQ